MWAAVDMRKPGQLLKSCLGEYARHICPFVPEDLASFPAAAVVACEIPHPDCLLDPLSLKPSQKPFLYNKIIISPLLDRIIQH